MDFRPPAQAAPSFLDPSVGRDAPHLTGSIRPQDLGMGLEWDSGYLAVEDGPTGVQIDPYTSQMLETPDVTEGFGLYDALGSAMGGLEALPSQPSAVGSYAKRSSSSAAQNSSRAARNGREQQRAQKISDMIDQLKVRFIETGTWRWDWWEVVVHEWKALEMALEMARTSWGYMVAG